MSARIIAFRVGAPTTPPKHLPVLPDHGPIPIVVPFELARRELGRFSPTRTKIRPQAFLPVRWTDADASRNQRHSKKR